MKHYTFFNSSIAPLRSHLIRYAAVITNNPALAEEAVQEVLTEAVEHIEKYIHNSHIEATLKVRVKNKSFELMRIEHRYVSYGEYMQDRRAYFNFESKAVDILACGETRSVIFEAVSRLPGRLQRVILLYYWNQLTLREIASLLNTSISTVSRQKAHAEKMLVGDLKAQGLDLSMFEIIMLYLMRK